MKKVYRILLLIAFALGLLFLRALVLAYAQRRGKKREAGLIFGGLLLAIVLLLMYCFR